MTRGFTLIELLTVVAIMALATVTLLPRARALVDRLAVDGAREEVVALLSRVRSTAVAHGGAVLHIRAEESSVALRTAAGDETFVIDLRDQYGVEIDLGRGRKERTLRFDALGIGRVASQQIRFHRGATEASLVVSSFGRIVRR